MSGATLAGLVLVTMFVLGMAIFVGLAVALFLFVRSHNRRRAEEAARRKAGGRRPDDSSKAPPVTTASGSVSLPALDPSTLIGLGSLAPAIPRHLPGPGSSLTGPTQGHLIRCEVRLETLPPRLRPAEQEVDQTRPAWTGHYQTGVDQFAGSIMQLGDETWVATRWSGILVVAQGPRLVGHYTLANLLPDHEVCCLATSLLGEPMVGTRDGFLELVGGVWRSVTLPRSPEVARQRTDWLLPTVEGLWLNHGGRVYHRSPTGDWFVARGLPEADMGGFPLHGEGFCGLAGRRLLVRTTEGWFALPPLRGAGPYPPAAVSAGEDGLFILDREGLFRTDLARLKEGGPDWRIQLPYDVDPEARQPYRLYWDGERLWVANPSTLWRWDGSRGEAVSAEGAEQELPRLFRQSCPHRSGHRWTAPAPAWFERLSPTMPLPHPMAQRFHKTQDGLLVQTFGGWAEWSPEGWVQSPFAQSLNRKLFESRGSTPTKTSHDSDRDRPRAEVTRTVSGEMVAAVWSCRRLRVYRWKGERLEALPSNGLPQHPVSGLEEDGEGALAVATSGGLAIWDGSAWQPQRAAEGLVTKEVQFLRRDHWGRLWAADWFALFRREGQKWHRICVPFASQNPAMEGIVDLEFTHWTLWVRCEDRPRFSVVASAKRGLRRPCVPGGIVGEVLDVGRGRELALVHFEEPHPRLVLAALEGDQLAPGRSLELPSLLRIVEDVASAPDGSVWLATGLGVLGLTAETIEALVGPPANLVPLTREQLDAFLPLWTATPAPVTPWPGSLPPLLEVARRFGLLGQVGPQDLKEGPGFAWSVHDLLVKHHGYESDHRDVGDPMLTPLVEQMRDRAGFEVEIADYGSIPERSEEPYQLRVLVRGEEEEWNVPEFHDTLEFVASRLNRLLEQDGSDHRVYLQFKGDACEILVLPILLATMLQEGGVEYLPSGTG